MNVKVQRGRRELAGIRRTAAGGTRTSAIHGAIQCALKDRGSGALPAGAAPAGFPSAGRTAGAFATGAAGGPAGREAAGSAGRTAGAYVFSSFFLTFG